MFDPKLLEEIAQKITRNMPDSLKTFQADMEKNVRAILTNAFAKLDLVTREEFDIQTEVLAKTREKLEALETELNQLEQSLHPAKKSNSPSDNLPPPRIPDVP